MEAAGWTVGSVKEFLGLPEADAALIEMKLALSRSLRERRKKYGLSQVQLAERLHSSQSRIAKMEAGDPSCRWISWSARYCCWAPVQPTSPRPSGGKAAANPAGLPNSGNTRAQYVLFSGCDL